MSSLFQFMTTGDLRRTITPLQLAAERSMGTRRVRIGYMILGKRSCFQTRTDKNFYWLKV